MQTNSISDDALKGIEKTILKGEKVKKNEINFLTGSDLLDLAVGGGEYSGYPGGKIINIVGDKSSGKTFLACEMIAATKYKYKKNFKWVYDDCESGFSFNTQDLYGFEIMPILAEERKRSTTVEKLYCNIRDFLEGLKKDDIGIYVVDSLDGLSSQEGLGLADERYKAFQKGKEYDQGSYRLGKAKYLSQEFFPGLAELVEKKHALLVVISQVRENVDPMSFEKYSRSGGKAMDFYCHTVLWLAQVNKIKRKERSIGIEIKAKTTKSKTARPYREVFFPVLFSYGIDNVAGNVDFLFDFLTPTGMIVKGPIGSWGGSCTIEDIKAFLAENEKEMWYRENVQPKLKKSEVMEWLHLEKNKELLGKFETKFSADMSREELIAYVEQQNLDSQLTERVKEKWESIEESIKIIRRPKYTDR